MQEAQVLDRDMVQVPDMAPVMVHQDMDRYTAHHTVPMVQDTDMVQTLARAMEAIHQDMGTDLTDTNPLTRGS